MLETGSEASETKTEATQMGQELQTTTRVWMTWAATSSSGKSGNPWVALGLTGSVRDTSNYQRSKPQTDQLYKDEKKADEDEDKGDNEVFDHFLNNNSCVCELAMARFLIKSYQYPESSGRD